MPSIRKAVKRFSHSFRRSELTTDNVVFYLHYKVTVIFLLALGLTLALIHFTTEPISCYNEDQQKATQCWIHGTFITKSHLEDTGSEVPKHYRWAFLKIIFHAVFFYVPRFLWKIWEGGKMKRVTTDLSLLTDEEKEEVMEMLQDYMSRHKKTHNWYLICFAVCELLNFVNAVVHLCLLDNYLGNPASKHGLNLLSLTDNDGIRTDALSSVFPRMVECQFKVFGSDHSVNPQSLLCVLPNSVLYEKVFAVILLWLVALSVISGLALVYRIVVCSFPDARSHILASRCRHVHIGVVDQVVRGRSVGDWFVLYQLSKNVGLLVLRDILKLLADDRSNPKRDAII